MAIRGGAATGGPTHLAMIMDGNGRWATRRGLERVEGHSAGEAAILAAVDAALSSQVPWLTLFAFSTENWNRPAAEVAFLMDFNRRVIDEHGGSFHSRGVRVRYMGRPERRIPQVLREAMHDIEELTRENDAMTLTLAFNYGGRDEIREAVRRILDAGLSSSEITESTIAQHMQYPDMPDIDMLVRTAGEHRLSNFALWRLAYAEMVFLPTLWPDVTESTVHEAISEYRRRDRRFGSIA
ncbi:polyprenyl diphosphate synthase [Geodermatophilus normandii]|uniref:polyprenyl diphosphate synthase n=1 Tax=Geodermatophilus normandii TaxID=1137989 RepID=UPI000D713B19|nr:polyprenyl diphosphate synthase [Geodermatophilus normandii]